MSDIRRSTPNGRGVAAAQNCQGGIGRGPFARASVHPSLKAVKRRASPRILETPARPAADGRKNDQRAVGFS